MKKTYTEYKLADRALVILSQLFNDRPSHYHGVALQSLEQKGLAENMGREKYPKSHRITDAGREAFAQARKEGW